MIGRILMAVGLFAVGTVLIFTPLAGMAAPCFLGSWMACPSTLDDDN